MDTRDREIRNYALRDAAFICRAGIYKGDHYNRDTDTQDSTLRRASDEILKLVEESE